MCPLTWRHIIICVIESNLKCYAEKNRGKEWENIAYSRIEYFCIASMLLEGLIWSIKNFGRINIFSVLSIESMQEM